MRSFLQYQYSGVMLFTLCALRTPPHAPIRVFHPIPPVRIRQGWKDAFFLPNAAGGRNKVKNPNMTGSPVLGVCLANSRSCGNRRLV